MHNPAEFSKHNKNTIRDAQELMTKYKNSFKWSSEPEDILEVGCANGSITSEVVYQFVEEHLNELIGSDVSREAIEVANKLYKKPKLSFETIDIAEENLWEKYENRFGHIVSFYTFHLVPHPEIWSVNLFKMLKRKGQVFIVMVLPPHPFPLALRAQKADKSAPWAKYAENCPDLFTDFGDNPSETVKNIFRTAGFDIDLAEVIRLKSTYQNFESLSVTGLAVNNIQKYIPDDLRPVYIEDFLKKLRENVHQSEDGSFYYEKNVLILVATKP